VFPLPDGLPAGSVLRLHFAHQHRPLTRIRLLSGDAWRVEERRLVAIATLMYTMLLSFALVTACLWVMVRERLYALFAGMLLAWAAFMMSNSGALYAIPGGALFAAAGLHGQWCLVTLIFALSFDFTREFLDVARHAPRVARWLLRARNGLLAAAVAILVAPWPVAWYGMAMAGLALVVYPAEIAVAAHVVRRGERWARYFLVGWAAIAVASALRAIQSTGLVPIDDDVAHLYALGIAAQAVVLMLGLADRLLHVRRERDLARAMAERDELTGLLNRRALDQRLRAATDEARANAAALSVVFLDLDHFKRINDDYGHAAGDRVLVEAARRVAHELRAGDFLGRWGGEEFVALLPGAGVEDARRVSERVRAAVAAAPVCAGDATIPVTISLGIAVFDADRDDVAALTARADRALYRAKAAGRNRVEVHGVAVAA
jgi:diguanylate cyclase (GGDEF)-like protein